MDLREARAFVNIYDFAQKMTDEGWKLVLFETSADTLVYVEQGLHCANDRNDWVRGVVLDHGKAELVKRVTERVTDPMHPLRSPEEYAQKNNDFDRIVQEELHELFGEVTPAVLVQSGNEQDNVTCTVRDKQGLFELGDECFWELKSMRYRTIDTRTANGWLMRACQSRWASQHLEPTPVTRTYPRPDGTLGTYLGYVWARDIKRSDPRVIMPYDEIKRWYAECIEPSYWRKKDNMPYYGKVQLREIDHHYDIHLRQLTLEGRAQQFAAMEEQVIGDLKAVVMFGAEDWPAWGEPELVVEREQERDTVQDLER